MSFDNPETCYYMSEPAGSQGVETQIPHDATCLLCGYLNASVFIGPRWQDVMPIPAFQHQAALFYKVNNMRLSTNERILLRPRALF